jgi:hypothetical protein
LTSEVHVGEAVISFRKGTPGPGAQQDAVCRRDQVKVIAASLDAG